LQRELGIEPSAATRAVYEAVLDATPSDAADIAGASPFIGRRDELHTLRAVWHDAAAGRAQLVLVSGEAGIGKTRLLDELRGQTAAVTAEARAYPAEDSIVYGLPTAWLRSRAVEKRLSRLEREHLIELGRLLPELSGHVPAPEPLPEAELRRRLFAAIVRALLAAGSPLLLIADDVHWADEQSLRLIRYLLRAAPSARLLVAATARREELDERHPVGRMVSALQTDARYTEIGLERLDRAETGQLAARISGKGLSKSELDHLYGDSEGNPLFIVEALRPDAPAATTKVQAVIVRRLERLSEPAGELVGTAAAIGRSFAADVLAAAAGLEDRAFVRALDELWRRGIVRDHGPGAYDFSHGRIRDAAYARLSPPRRRQAHLAIARALEQSEGAAAASIARHYESAAAPADAIRWHERAAGNAQWLHAHSEAVLELERALTLSEELQPGRDKARLQLRLLTALPAPLLAVAGYAPERLSEIHAKARQLAAQLAVDPEPPLVWSMALSALVRGEWQTGRELAERLRARAQRNQDPVLRVESDYILGIASYWVGELRSARSHFEAAIELFRPERRRAHVLRYGQDPELVVRLRLAHTLWLLGHDAAADRQRELALAAVHDSSHPYSRAITYLWAAIFAMDRADVAEFRRQVHAVDPYVTDDAPGQVRLPMELFTGYLEVLDGQREVGLARLRDAQEQLVAAPFTPGQPGLATRILLAGHAVAAEPEQGLALADAALGMGRGAELWEAEIRRLRAIFLAELGAFAEEVQAELDLALGVARRQGARAFERRIRGTLTERRASHDRVL
jgi:hypothetical protein